MRAMGKMTVQQLEALRAGDWETVDTGLQIRVNKTGVKTWIVLYVIHGKQREHRLPRPYGKNTDDGHLSLKDARGEAEKIRALARQGIDFKVQQELAQQAETKRVADERAAEQARKAREQTENRSVSDLFNAWITDGVRRKDNNAELRRAFNADVLPMIGVTPIKTLTEHDLRSLLRRMVGRGVNRAAVVMRNDLAQMFAWAEKRQPWRKLLAEGNPMDLIEIDKLVSPDYALNNQRDRILSSDEIWELQDIFRRMHAEYDASPDRRTATQPVEQTVQRAIWIMLSTLCRVGELSMARWEHIDFEGRAWFVPKENVKGNLQDFTVYLSEFALEQFRELHILTGHTEWCFPARNREGHVCVKSMSKQIGDRQTMFKKGMDGGARKPMKHRRNDNTLVLGNGKNSAWTPHDLRRTGATMMQSLGIALDVIDRCQNHVLVGSKVRRHYLHHDYADEKREAWRLLGEKLSLVLCFG
jgi:integrase